MPDAGRQRIGELLAEATAAVDAALPLYLPPATGPAARLGQAVAHSLAGGKRLRPMLVGLAADTFGLSPDAVTPTACAFELLHTATLVHDDLPALDNADLRRGLPSCHAAYGEATALLAGDALIIAAFAALADQARAPATPPERVVAVVADFADAVQALIQGELADIEGEERPPDAELLGFIHLHKTAALIACAARSGARLAGAAEGDVAAVSAYATALGLLFQVTDDLLDAVGDSAQTGKPVGLDAAAGKQTYPAVYGVGGARERAEALAEEARRCAEGLPRNVEAWGALVGVVLGRDA
jgi:geranylgeranyl diphosphate synthase type II